MALTTNPKSHISSDLDRWLFKQGGVLRGYNAKTENHLILFFHKLKL
jgi:hypothetical protein